MNTVDKKHAFFTLKIVRQWMNPDLKNMKLSKTLAKGCVAALVAVAALAFSMGADAQTYMGKVEVRSVRGDGTSAEFILWCVGATLFAHCVTFFAIGYFDQSYVFLFLLVGSVPGLTSAAVRSRLSRSHKSVPQPAAVEIRTSRRFFGTVQG